MLAGAERIPLGIAIAVEVPLAARRRLLDAVELLEVRVRAVVRRGRVLGAVRHGDARVHVGVVAPLALNGGGTNVAVRGAAGGERQSEGGSQHDKGFVHATWLNWPAPRVNFEARKLPAEVRESPWSAAPIDASPLPGVQQLRIVKSADCLERDANVGPDRTRGRHAPAPAPLAFALQP